MDSGCPTSSAGGSYWCGSCGTALDSVKPPNKWQSYVSEAGEKKWVLLCPPCQRSLWRDYTKLEDFPEWRRMCKEYLQWLGQEFEWKR